MNEVLNTQSPTLTDEQVAALMAQAHTDGGFTVVDPATFDGEVEVVAQTPETIH